MSAQNSKSTLSINGGLAPLESVSWCPMSYAMSLIGGKWKCIILHQLRAEPQRFGALRRRMPNVTQRMLTLSLRDLESDGLVHRHVHHVVPPHVEYSLTDLGKSLMPVLSGLADWGVHYYEACESRKDNISG